MSRLKNLLSVRKAVPPQEQRARALIAAIDAGDILLHGEVLPLVSARSDALPGDRRCAGAAECGGAGVQEGFTVRAQAGHNPHHWMVSDPARCPQHPLLAWRAQGSAVDPAIGHIASHAEVPTQLQAALPRPPLTA